VERLAAGTGGRRTGLLMLTILLTASVLTQAPVRPQELRLPGLDYVLRTGWQLILREGCRFAVPGSWHAAKDGALVLSADGSYLSTATAHFASWIAHKSQVRAAFGAVRAVHEDSDRRLWLEIGDAHASQHYVDVSIGGGACIAILDLPRTTTLTGDDIMR